MAGFLGLAEKWRPAIVAVGFHYHQIRGVRLQKTHIGVQQRPLSVAHVARLRVSPVAFYRTGNSATAIDM